MELDLNKAIAVGLGNYDGVTGQGAAVVATGVAPTEEHPSPLGGEVAYHTMFFAVWQRNRDGSIKTTEDGRPIPALDANSKPMVGPILLAWSPDALTVKNPSDPTGEAPAEGQPDEREPKDLTFLAEGGEEVNRKVVKVGAFVASGGGGGTTCAGSLNTLGVLF